MKYKIIMAVGLAIIIALTIYGCSRPSDGGSSEKAVGTAIPEKYLDERELELYRLLLECMTGVSAGERPAETFYFNVSKPFSNVDEYEQAIKKVMFFIRNYTPAYSYWTDSRGSYVYDTTKCAVSYGVSPVYRAFGNEKMIRSDRLDEVNRALDNAKSIADKYSGKSDYDKVIGYAKEICRLNSYNDTAADTDGYSQKNIDPWSIIYVFDRDPTTNVVCAGYSRAFQYLCSLGGIECHYVTGYVNDGYHGWNIVVINGKNYLVDLTVCDSYPENIIEKYHPFVLNSVVSSTAEGFDTYYSRSGLTYYRSYTYAENELAFLPEELRLIEKKDYSPGKTVSAVLFVIVVGAGVTGFIIFKRKMAAVENI